MKIEKSELIEFANDPGNKIETGQCDTNAIRVSVKYKCEIYLGKATYIDKENHQKTVPHYWNVLKFKSNTGEIVEQIIDIINYKVGDKKGIYINHRSGIKISKEEMMKNSSTEERLKT